MPSRTETQYRQHHVPRRRRGACTAQQKRGNVEMIRSWIPRREGRTRTRQIPYASMTPSAQPVRSVNPQIETTRRRIRDRQNVGKTSQTRRNLIASLKENISLSLSSTQIRSNMSASPPAKPMQMRRRRPMTTKSGRVPHTASPLSRAAAC